MGQEIIREDIIRENGGYVTRLIFNRPEKKNALNEAALYALGDAVREIEKENKTRVVVLRGTGDKVFSSGADLSGGSKQIAETVKALEYCLEGLINFPIPVISMIYGPAIGAGLDISVISDLRIAEETSRFGAPLVKLGRTYYYTAIERLTHLTGMAAAKELLLTGQLINSRRALEIGLVHKVVAHSELESTVMSIAEKIADGTAPLAVKATKLTIKRVCKVASVDSSVEEELRQLLDVVNKSEDAEEGVKAMLEKRKPVFKGR